MAPKLEKNTGPYSFLNSSDRLRNNFANDMRSKKNRVALGTRIKKWIVFLDTRKFSDHSLSGNVSYASSDQALLRCRCQTDLSTVQGESKDIKKLPWTSIFSSDKLFPARLSFC